MKIKLNSIKQFLKNNYIIIICAIAIIIKQAMFQGSTGHGMDGNKLGLYFNKDLKFVHIAIVLMLVIPAFLLKNKWKTYYMFIVDCLFSIMCILDLWVYRAADHVIGFRYLFNPDLMNVTGESLIQIRKTDILFVVDIIIILVVLYFSRKRKIESKRSFIGAILYAVILICVISFGITSAKEKGEDFWDYGAATGTNIRTKGVIGYKISEAYDSIRKEYSKPDENELEEVSDWLEKNQENLPDNEYKGMFKGKNVMLLQIESLEDFVINQSAYGQEITPNLNKMLSNSLYFNNIYEQNYAGSSIDCDFMINTSVLPLDNEITGLYHPEVEYLGLPKVLKEDNYTTALTHVELNSAWAWAESGKKYGFDKLWNEKQYIFDEYVGYGLSDESFYRQFGEKLKDLKQPFFTQSPTLSSHGPFDYPEQYKFLELPKEVDENIMGGYLQGIHYADKQIGNFVEQLDKDGYLDNTVLIIYGDHAGVNKYYKSKLEGFDMEGDWWKTDELKVPLIIYSKDMEEKKIETKGGIVDLYPTLCYLLDTTNKEYKNYTMGRNLLNTNRTATVSKNQIVGTPSSEEEKELLENAYSIGKKYILNNYYENKK